MSHFPANPTHAPDPDRDAVMAQKRRVIKQRPMEPLDPRRRYVQPDTSNVSVIGGFFFRSRSFKMNRRTFGPDGLSAPTVQSREKFKFNEYFELGTGIKLKPTNVNWELNVHRNRLVFFGVLLVVLVYCAFWISG